VIRRDSAAVRITATPGQHAPHPLAALLPPVMGSVLEFGQGDRTTFRMYITGDTLLHDRLAEIPRLYPNLDLCLLHLGGTRVAGVLLTMDAAQGVRALRLIAPKTAIPIHYDDYTVFRSPLSDFVRQVDGTDLPTEVVYLERGATHRFDVTVRS
jgi:L-ascorbate metabolism protein UlaG (beta-lactamase superfamily)